MPVTPDHVNPEAPWPHLDALAVATKDAGRHLVERLAIVPRFTKEVRKWLDKRMAGAVLRASDATGHARCDSWFAGAGSAPPSRRSGHGSALSVTPEIRTVLSDIATGEPAAEDSLALLFTAHGQDYNAIMSAAQPQHQLHEISVFIAAHSALFKGWWDRATRGPAYRLDFDDIAQRTVEAGHVASDRGNRPAAPSPHDAL